MNTYYNSEEVKNMHGTLKPVFVKTDRAVMSDPELSQRAKDLYCLLCSMVRRGVVLRRFRRSSEPCINLHSEFIIGEGTAHCYMGNSKNFYVTEGSFLKMKKALKKYLEESSNLLLPLSAVFTEQRAESKIVFIN